MAGERKRFVFKIKTKSGRIVGNIVIEAKDIDWAICSGVHVPFHSGDQFETIRCGTPQRPRCVILKVASSADHVKMNGGAALNSFVMVTADGRRSRIDG
ncbi:MAG: hypothetical protein ABSG68_08590 [Thermoguttaceae bacterium]